MTTLDDVYTPSGDFLKSEHLEGADPVDAKIEDYEVGKWDDGKGRIDLKLRFENGKVMSWSCNPTNGRRISKLAGSKNLDDWIGQEITIYHDPSVEFGGKLVGGLRVKMPVGEATGKKAAFLADDKATADPSDEIPF